MKKVIIITGASSGFGKATAKYLSDNGHTVYGICRREMKDEKIHYISTDIRNSEEIRKRVGEIVEKEGKIDVLINNAGMGIGGSIELATDEEIDNQIGTNFYGCVNLCRAVLPYMRERREGQIINLSSIGGIMGLPYQGYYSASKFAIEGFSEALATEVKRFGIKISMVEPGDFATNFTSSRKNSVATLNDKDYGSIFRTSLDLIEKSENNGLKPEKLAKKINKIINTKKPHLRYVVATGEQWLSVIVKRILPGNWFVNILRDYYKS